MTTAHEGPARATVEAHQEGPGGGKDLKLSHLPVSCCPYRSFHQNELLFKPLNVRVFPLTLSMPGSATPQTVHSLTVSDQGGRRCPKTRRCDCLTTNVPQGNGFVFDYSVPTSRSTNTRSLGASTQGQNT